MPRIQGGVVFPHLPWTEPEELTIKKPGVSSYYGSYSEERRGMDFLEIVTGVQPISLDEPWVHENTDNTRERATF